MNSEEFRGFLQRAFERLVEHSVEGLPSSIPPANALAATLVSPFRTWVASALEGLLCLKGRGPREIKILMRLLSKNTNELKTGAPGRFGSETSEAWLANGS